MKIIVAGAGMGGLVAAWKLGEAGHEVEVFEKAASANAMRYDWHDDLTPDIFAELGLEMPREHFSKPDWTFVAPFDKAELFVPTKGDRDVSIERRPLNAALFEKAAQYARISFGRTVGLPVIKDGKVAGCEIDGEKVYCDLLVDSLGAFSILRSNLSEKFYIPKQPDKNEIFYAFRGYFNLAENQDLPEPYTHRVYMKHLGKSGISWCSLDDGDKNMVDVLVGHVGELSETDLNEGLADLREKNKWLGNKLLRGGEICRIPVRKPLSRFVADGYAAVGDSAFMTIPMLGSGMVAAMRAGNLLAKTVNESNDVSAKSLWNYQVEIYKTFGARHCGIEVLKNGMLSFSNELLTWLFSSGVLSDKDLSGASVGSLVKVQPKDLPEKLIAGRKHIPWLLTLNNLVAKAWKKVKTAENIPTVFYEKAILAWQKKIDG